MNEMVMCQLAVFFQQITFGSAEMGDTTILGTSTAEETFGIILLKAHMKVEVYKWGM